MRLRQTGAKSSRCEPKRSRRQPRFDEPGTKFSQAIYETAIAH